jgi:hypothetical protein
LVRRIFIGRLHRTGNLPEQLLPGKLNCVTLQKVRHLLIAFVVGGLLVSGAVLAQQKQASAPAAPSKTSSTSVPELTPVSNPATASQIRELLELTGATRNANLLVGHIIDQMKQQSPSFFPQDFWTDMQQSFKRLDTVSLLVPYFQKYYSQPDAEKAIAFYRSPAGKRLVSIQPVIMQETQKIVMDRARAVSQQVVQRHKAEIEALAKQYQQQRGAGGAAPQNSSPGSQTQPKK